MSILYHNRQGAKCLFSLLLICGNPKSTLKLHCICLNVEQCIIYTENMKCYCLHGTLNRAQCYGLTDQIQQKLEPQPLLS